MKGIMLGLILLVLLFGCFGTNFEEKECEDKETEELKGECYTNFAVQGLQKEYCDMIAYKTIREDLFKRLNYILNRSEHVQENIEIYEYVINAFLPELSKEFVFADNKASEQEDEDFTNNILVALGL